jgi:hypothetical protein
MVDGLKGVVADISLRTTKLRTYDRNEIIIPNSTLLRQNIINITGGARARDVLKKLNPKVIYAALSGFGPRARERECVRRNVKDKYHEYLTNSNGEAILLCLISMVDSNRFRESTT